MSHLFQSETGMIIFDSKYYPVMDSQDLVQQPKTAFMSWGGPDNTIEILVLRVYFSLIYMSQYPPNFNKNNRSSMLKLTKDTLSSAGCWITCGR